MEIAIITGASSGMGKEFVKKIDQEGLDEIWGIALEQELLDEVEKDTKTKFRKFALDLTNKENIEFLIEVLNKARPKIKWLVNASGFGKFARHDEYPLEVGLNMIDLNVKALVSLTEICCSYMDNGSKIVQFGSVAAFQPIPYIAVYGATKAFVLSYSRAIAEELKPRGITVTCACPYWTKTKFFDRAVVNKQDKNKVVTKYVCMYDADKVVNRIYNDALKGKQVSKYGFIARSQILLVKLLPTKLVMNIWLKQQNLRKKYANKEILLENENK